MPLLILLTAASVDVTYEVGTSTKVTYEFSQVQNPLEIPLTFDASTIRVNNEPIESSTNTIQITNDSTITFFTQSLTQQESFVADLSRLQTTLGEVRVYLPSEARLTRSLEHPDASIRPAPTHALTDGQRLIFVYEAGSLEPARAIVIDYTTPNTYPIISTTIIVLLVAMVAALLMRRRVVKKHALTTNLFEEEKQLVDILLAAKNQELWQKELTKQSGLSKVKVSRKLRNLRAKGVIEKIPHGNTNKIRIKKHK